MNEDLQKVYKALQDIEERNCRVEADKAWETSLFRTLTISALTFATTALVFSYMGIPNYLTNACIPTLGFLISTQSLPVLKRWWIDRHNKSSAKKQS